MPAGATWREWLRSVPVEEYQWAEVNDNAPWEARAGLEVVNLRGTFYLMGGRTPLDPMVAPAPFASKIWGDVWKSRDRGRTWRRVLETDDSSHWPARAYFEAVKKGRYMYIIGGQNFNVIPNPKCTFAPQPCELPDVVDSEFFNDVWKSRDGVHWTQVTASAPWEGRAGLSAVVHRGAIYVMAGSVNDDSAVIGGPPTRIYFNDVWKSYDGANWKQVTEAAPWTPRAGAVVVTKGYYIYLLGGEDGFNCLSGDRCPPYYNDVWRTKDGKHWEEVTPAAGWQPRPGHTCEVVRGEFVCFGGFGLALPKDPIGIFPANPLDVWTSRDGATWMQISDSPWNALTSSDVKYDFASVVARGLRGPVIYTFGGDRETFNFFDPTNYLNVDNDVWRYGPERWRSH
jgi:hypothetical protein